MTKEENQQRLARLKNIVLTLPEKPGSYQFYDASGTIIYVGKAKSLKARVSSYFHKEVDRFKTRVLVSKIWNITYTVVNTEEDALLLENALIKQYQPRYNILLKDGKTYPSICITNEPFPRVFKTRQINKKQGQHFGPYSHVGTMYALLEVIKKLYRPRTCRQTLTPDGVAEGRYKPCLEYHIHHCDAPCIGKQSRDDYLENIRQAREILRGHTRDIQRELRERMMAAADEWRFEDAQALKQQCETLEHFAAKSEVVSHVITDVDVFSLTNDENVAFVNYLHVTNGCINQAFTYEFKKKIDETDEDVLSLAILQIREKLGSTAREIVLPFELDIPIKGAVVTVPQRGDRKTLLELSLMNGKQYKFDRLKQAEKLNPEQRQTRLMKELQKALQLPRLPMVIELFDNSNISGTDAVAGCVVFRSMKPSKKDYRKYNIKTVTGPDDYASMQEVVRRRYTRMMEEGAPLPDLIVTDGGVGQMNVVKDVVVGELQLDIPVAGLAKNDRHRTNELIYGTPPMTVAIDVKSELFRVLTQMQDEVHRYAITFHRDKRSKRALHSELDDIAGIGPKTKAALLKHFHSVKRIAAASADELAEVVGAAKAAAIRVHFQN